MLGAVAWRIVAELIRRHGQRYRLRVLETHPGGGHYDCLSLTQDASGVAHAVHVAAFNLRSGRLTVFHPIGRVLEADPWRQDLFAEHALRTDDLRQGVDRAEALLDLPALSSLPLVTPVASSLRILALAMEAQAFVVHPLFPQCAWHDSSGMEGSFVEPWLSPVFPAVAKAAHSASPWQEQARHAARVWRIGEVSFDIVTGRAVRAAKPDRVEELLRRTPRMAAAWLLEAAG